jgi:hypothetical protein
MLIENVAPEAFRLLGSMLSAQDAVCDIPPLALPSASFRLVLHSFPAKHYNAQCQPRQPLSIH